MPRPWDGSTSSRTPPARGVPELLETGQERAYKAGTKGAIEGLKEGLGIGKSDRRE